MLPGSLDVGSSALLTSTRAGQAVRTMPSESTMVAVFAGACRVLSTWQERAQGRRALSRLDDHLLRDIGLSRADVERELMKPFWRA
jgi:uncharacterized protein YjiS (DUF1127 family)